MLCYLFRMIDRKSCVRDTGRFTRQWTSDSVNLHSRVYNSFSLPFDSFLHFFLSSYLTVMHHPLPYIIIVVCLYIWHSWSSNITYRSLSTTHRLLLTAMLLCIYLDDVVWSSNTACRSPPTTIYHSPPTVTLFIISSDLISCNADLAPRYSRCRNLVFLRTKLSERTWRLGSTGTFLVKLLLLAWCLMEPS